MRAVFEREVDGDGVIPDVWRDTHPATRLAQASGGCPAGQLGHPGLTANAHPHHGLVQPDEDDRLRH